MKQAAGTGELYVYCPSDKFMEFVKGQYACGLINEHELLLQQYQWDSYKGSLGLLVLFDGRVIL